MKWNLYPEMDLALAKEVDEDDTYAAPYKTLGSRWQRIADVITAIMQQREPGKDIKVSGDRAKVCEPYDSLF